MKGRSSGGVFVTTYFSFKDALMQAYTLPYVRLIRASVPEKFPVYLLSVEKKEDRLDAEELKSTVARLKSEGIDWVRLPYYRFGPALMLWIPSLLRLAGLIRRTGIGSIHAWCLPGGIIGYFLSVLTGRLLVLDSFEPHAEVMSETGTWSRYGIKFKVFFSLEKKMARRAGIHILCTEDMADYSERKYGIRPQRTYLKPSCVDLARFDISRRKNPELLSRLGLQKKIVAVYAGKFGGLYLTEEVFELCKAAYDRWGDRFRLLLLSRELESNIRRWSEKAGLPSSAIIQLFVPHAEVADYIGLGDFGLAPYAPVPSRKHAAPIKVSEYWALGLPVIITSGIADDSELIRTHCAGSVIGRPDKEEYARCIRETAALIEDNGTVKTYERIRPLAEKYRNFDIARSVYRSIYGNDR